MKIISPAIVFVLITISIHAQTEKGGFLVGGSMNLERLANGYTVLSSGQSFSPSPLVGFSASPTVGYFVVNNLMVGLQPSISYTWAPNHSEYAYRAYSLGSLARYYIRFGKFAIFPEAAVSFANQYFKSTTIDPVSGFPTPYNETINGISHHEGVGISWFIAPNVGIEGILGYRNTDYKNTRLNTQPTLYLNFGIQVYIPKRY